MIDIKLQEGTLAKSIVYRRALNPQPQMGEPVGGKQ